MSKELEALESIKRTIQQLDYGFISKEDYDDFALIETSLKELELLKSNQIFIERAKKLRALETIKNKNVCVHDLKKSETLEEYNGCREWEEELTQEEFNLLKEVLL